MLAERLPGYDPGDSDFETRVLRLVIGAGLPVPRQQYRVRIGRKKYEVDLACPDEKIAIELDGWEFHGTRTAFDADRHRTNALVLAGWIPLRFTSTTSDAAIIGSITAARTRSGRAAS